MRFHLPRTMSPVAYSNQRQRVSVACTCYLAAAPAAVANDDD